MLVKTTANQKFFHGIGNGTPPGGIIFEGPGKERFDWLYTAPAALGEISHIRRNSYQRSSRQTRMGPAPHLILYRAGRQHSWER
jgi:hypothetical protein